MDSVESFHGYAGKAIKGQKNTIEMVDGKFKLKEQFQRKEEIEESEKSCHSHGCTDRPLVDSYSCSSDEREAVHQKKLDALKTMDQKR